MAVFNNELRKFMKVRQSALVSWCELGPAHCGPQEVWGFQMWVSVRKGAYVQPESAGTETDCVLGGRRVESRNRREVFLEEVGPALSCGDSIRRTWRGSQKSGLSAGMVRVRTQERVGSSQEISVWWICAPTLPLNCVSFFVGHFTWCSEVLVCIYRVLIWIWSR